MNATGEKGRFTLHDLNNRQIQKLLAPIIYLVVLMFVGIPGNLTVLHVYWRKFSKSVYKIIIWNIAVVDFLFCLIAIPFIYIINIGELVRYYMFYELWVCKLFAVCIIFAVIYCAHLLVILAVYRFVQVYIPMKLQVNPTSVKYLIAVGFGLAVLFDIPQGIFQPIVEVSLEQNITRYVCAITYKTSVYADIYNGFLTFIFVFYSVLLLVMYLLIGRKMYLQRIQRQTSRKLSNQSDKLPGKITKIAVAVSVIFGLSYVPIFIIKLIASKIRQEDLTTTQFAVLKIFERSYVVNHVTNPIVYAYFDKRFRSQLSNLCSGVHYKREYCESTSKSTSRTENQKTNSDVEETTEI